MDLKLVVSTIRGLSMDSVQAANSGQQWVPWQNKKTNQALELTPAGAAHR